MKLFRTMNEYINSKNFQTADQLIISKQSNIM